MKRELKPITLKEDTLNDIKEGKIDTDLFIERIKEYRSKANYLIDNKMEDMEDIELLRNLEEVFNITYDDKDYLRMLTFKYGKHYISFKHIKTNMYEEDNNISYLCATTSKVNYPDGKTLDFKTLAKLTNSGDILLIKKIPLKITHQIRKVEKYKDLYVDEIDIDSKRVDKESSLYPYAAILVRKETIIKYVLYDLKDYNSEISHQARTIFALSKLDDEELSKIGKLYRSSYDKASAKGLIPKEKKVYVKYHQNKRKNIK